MTVTVFYTIHENDDPLKAYTYGGTQATRGDVVALSGGGGATVNEDNSGYSDIGFYSAGGTLINTDNDFQAIDPAITQLTNGNVVVVGTKTTGIGYAIFSSSGTYLTGNTVTNAASYPYSNPDVAALSGGGFVMITQKDYGGLDPAHPLDHDIRYIVNDASGNLVIAGYLDQGTDDDENARVVGLADGGFAITGQRIVAGVGQIWVAVRNADGSSRAAVSVFDAVGANAAPTITALQNGGFAIAYTEDSFQAGNQDISYAQFNSSGVLVGSKLRVTTSVKPDTRPDMTTLSTGLVLISYAYDFNNDGSDIDTYAALINPATPSVILAQHTIDGTFNTTLFNSISAGPNGEYLYTYTDTTNNIAYVGQGELARISQGDGAADVINGDALADELYGAGGNDTLNAGGGDDYLEGGTGTNTLDGGAGDDTAHYGLNRASYTVTHNSNGTFTISGSGLTDTLSNIEYASFNDLTINLVAPNPRDFSSDNQSDLLMQYSDGRLAAWLMDGPDFVSGGLVGSPGSAWHAKATADFSGDGKSDILMQNDDGRIAVWKVEGTSFTGGAQIGGNPGSSWHVKDAVDFNGDGVADILMQNDDSRVAIWYTNQLGFVSGAQVGGTPGTAWGVKGAGDFDGDGKIDLVMQRSTGEIVIWKLDNGSFNGSLPVSNPGPGWHVRSVGDFNGDGKADMLLQHDDSRIAVWTMNGNSLTGAVVLEQPGPAWAVKGAYDFNGDNKADIVLQRTSGEIAVWTMSGLDRIGAALTGNPGPAWALVGPTGA